MWEMLDTGGARTMYKCYTAIIDIGWVPVAYEAPWQREVRAGDDKKC